MVKAQAAATRASSRKRKRPVKAIKSPRADVNPRPNPSEAGLVLSDDSGLTEIDNDEDESYKDGREASHLFMDVAGGITLFNDGKDVLRDDDETYDKELDPKEDVTMPQMSYDPGIDDTEDDEVEHRRPVIGMDRPDKKKLCIKAMGKVRIDANGKLQWLDKTRYEWRPAVYHKDIREQLIEDTAKLGAYKYEMNKGKNSKLDVTSFHPAYEENGHRRENWPKILFKYVPDTSDFMHVKPEYWVYHDGRIVIDCNNDAMYDFPEIPTTLARNADAWLLLAIMRLNNKISIQDLRGRMMGEINHGRADPLGRNRISMSIQRFRKFAGCLTWNAIRAVDVQKEYLDIKLPRRCIRLNSTESFRQLYRHEAAELEMRDAGKFLHRTRSHTRDLSQAKSEALHKKKVKEFIKLKQEFEKHYPFGTPHDYDTEDEEYHAQQLKFAEENPGVDIDEGFRPQPTRAPKTKTVKPIDATRFMHEFVCSMPPVTGFVPFTHTRKRVKLNQDATLSHNTLRNLPYHQAFAITNMGATQTKHAICPGGHWNYAGFFTTAPNNVPDAQLVFDLLEPTREHFKSCTGGLEPPRTEAGECYNCQHRDIQNALNEWHAQHIILGDEPAEQLVKISYHEATYVYCFNNWDANRLGPGFVRDDLALEQHDGVWVWGGWGVY
ncbi:MAG: hypothetical protein Q9170_005077 [Blastenia crenularia]